LFTNSSAIHGIQLYFLNYLIVTMKIPVILDKQFLCVVWISLVVFNSYLNSTCIVRESVVTIAAYWTVHSLFKCLNIGLITFTYRNFANCYPFFWIRSIVSNSWRFNLRSSLAMRCQLPPLSPILHITKSIIMLTSSWLNSIIRWKRSCYLSKLGNRRVLLF
jgi:hypothetical protein